MFKRRIVPSPLLAAAMLVSCSGLLAAQSPARGTISGTVTADQGQVRGFRVTAHNLQYKLWYTVFTVRGRYNIPQALPGLYDITVLEPGYASPTLPVQLGPGESKTLDFAVKQQAGANTGTGGIGEGDPRYTQGSGANVQWVDTVEEYFPAGQGRELIKENCAACHTERSFGPDWSTLNLNQQGFLMGIERMSETGPAFFSRTMINLSRTHFTNAQKEEMAEYLAKNFGDGVPERKMRVDPPIINEEALAKAIYVSYDTPSDMPVAPKGKAFGADIVDGVLRDEPTAIGRLGNYLHDPFIAPDGSIWYGAPVANAMMRLDQKELDPAKRWKIYPVKAPSQVFIHGITADHEGRMYWAEIVGGKLGELDPKTGKQIRHYVPVEGTMLQVVTDKDDNVWFGNVTGAQLGKLDARTRRVHTYPTPTPDNGIYGLAADQQGNVWGAGWQKGMIVKYDHETGAIVEYKVPNSWGQIRRIGVDSKGMVWGSEHNVGRIVELDPATGKMTEYQLPVRGAHPYDVWPDKSDNIWIADQSQSSLVKFDPQTKKFTFYPEPQLNQSLPKVEIEPNNTIWYGARGVPHITATHFYPQGYTADAPAEP